MQLSAKSVETIITRWVDEGIVTDYCSEYGEPGYSHSYALSDNDTPAIVLGSYWCHCAQFDGLHDYATHHPRLWEQLESQGVQFHWHDEWIIDHNSDKAYRTSADSYSWQSSIMYIDGDMLTPDDDIDTWLEHVLQNETPCLPGVVWSATDIINAGFAKYNGTYESGWHPGQDDNPVTIMATVKREYGEDTEVVFRLDSSGQFDINFSAYYRLPDES